MRSRSPLVLIIVLAACAGSLSASSAQPALPPAPAAVLAVTKRVANWQLAHPSAHPPTDWTQAAFYTGLMAFADVSHQPRYLNVLLKMGRTNEWKLGPRIYNADDQCVGQTYAELYFLRHDPRMIAPMRARFDWILAHPKDDNLNFDPHEDPDRLDKWSWCDSLFMGPPTWIHLFAATGDKAYLNFAVRNWWVTSDYLYDRNEHLYFRDSTYFNRREPNGKKVFWSRGNGWVMAGLVRMLQYLPPDDPAHARFVRQFRQMADAILSCQQPDGLWRSSLLDPTDYPLKETSGSGFFCYALTWGVNHRLLDLSRFTPAVLRAWNGLVGCVSPVGRLTHVQPIGADPRHFDGNATEVYGVGAFLLAGSEIYRLAQASDVRP